MADTDLIIRPAELKDVKDIMALEQGSIGTCKPDHLQNADMVLDECSIGNIVTRKDHRGEGLASMLWAELLRLLKEKGMAKVFLEVESDNVPAIALYEKSGFTGYGLRRDYYGQGRDAVLMLKDI